MEWLCCNCGEYNEVESSEVPDMTVCCNCGNLHYVYLDDDMEIQCEEL